MDLKISQPMLDALSKMNEGGFEQIATFLNDARTAVNEELKKQTASKINDIISKLSSGAALGADDVVILKMWVVGDAESFIALQDDFNDKVAEYKKSIDILKSYESKTCQVEDLVKLLGLLEDASHTSFSIADYLDKKMRIDNFNSAIANGLDQDERGYLVEFLNGKLHSEEY